MRTVLVDDEPLARERLRDLLGRTDVPVEVIGEANGGKQAIPLIHEQRPDLVFLDIQMPGLDGFDVVDLIAPPRPHIVFVTAYDEYALRAFEVHALDYLTKPVRLERLTQSLQRIRHLTEQHQPPTAVDAFAESRASAPLRRLTLQAGRRLRIIEPEEVTCFEAQDKLVFAHLRQGGSFPVDFTVQALTDRLDADRFLRVHRAFLVNVASIRELQPWYSGTYQLRLEDGRDVPVARRRVATVKALLRG